MSSEKPSLPVPRHPRIWWSRLVWKWPVLVWISVALLSWWLYNHGGDFRRINGMVEVTTESVSPLETGRLTTVSVVPGQSVEAGQAVAQLDTSSIDEELAVLAQELRQEKADDERQFMTARERLQSELRSYTLEEAEAEKQLEIYASEIERLEELVERGLAQASDLLDVRIESATLRSRLDLYSGFRESIETELTRLEEARAAAFAYHTSQGNGNGEPSRLNMLHRKKDELTLRTQQSGIVSQVTHESGDVVRAGDPVVEVIINRPPRILAFMNETDLRPVAVGDIVSVEAATGGSRFEARVEAISPNMISLEDRASPLPQRLVRGRRLELVPTESLNLTPGAGMIIYLPTSKRLEAFWGKKES